MIASASAGTSGNGLTGFLGWWAGELADLLAAPKRGGGRRLVLSLEAGRTELIEERGRTARTLDAAEPGDARALDRLCREARRRARGRRPAAIGVRLPRSAVLVRTLALPAAARRELRSLLALDLERATPLKAAEVAFDWVADERVRPDGLVDVRQVVVKRPILEAALADLAGRALPVAFVDCWGPDGALDVDLLSAASSAPEGRITPRLLLWLGLLAALLGGLAAMQAIAAREQALAALEEASAAARAKALVRQRAVQAAESRAQVVAGLWQAKAGRPAAVLIWEELTRLLPDSTYLTDLRLEGGELSLSGFSSSAADLVPLLSASPLLADAGLAAPVTFDQTVGKEHFDIRVRLRGSQPPAAPDAGAGP